MSYTKVTLAKATVPLHKFTVYVSSEYIKYIMYNNILYIYHNCVHYMLSTIPILRVYYIILDKGRAFNVHLKIQAFDSYSLFYKYTYKVTFTERAMGAVRTRNIIGSLVLQPIWSRVYMSIRIRFGTYWYCNKNGLPDGHIL